MIVYHASLSNRDKEVCYPRVPYNRMDDEDDTVERVCVSLSINGCLCGIGCSLDKHTVYIHSCKVNKKYLRQPTVDEVPDVMITGELWYTKEVRLKLVKVVKVYDEFVLEQGCDFPFTHVWKDVTDRYKYETTMPKV